MPIITKESANQHCRTCLTKLNDVAPEETLAKRLAPLEEEDDVKSISINLSTNENLRQLIENYIEKDMEVNNVEYPQNVCLSCFNKLQGFDKFRKQAVESVATLKSLFIEGGVTKVELDDEVEDEKETGNENIYSMMVGKMIFYSPMIPVFCTVLIKILLWTKMDYCFEMRNILLCVRS